MDTILAKAPTALCVSPRISCQKVLDCTQPKCHFPGKSQIFSLRTSVSPFNSSNLSFRQRNCSRISRLSVISAASSDGNAEYTEEPATNTKFQRSVSLPGCSSPLSLFGTGFREKSFAIIGVKVYAAGLYMNESVVNGLSAWKGRSAAEIEKDSSIISTISNDPAEKSLQVVLARNVDGKSFWEALDEAITPRIKSPTSDDTAALTTLRNVFQRTLNKGTVILLTWTAPSKMIVCVSDEGLPTNVDASIESANVASSLFDVFLGDSTVSPTLKSSVANYLAATLK